MAERIIPFGKYRGRAVSECPIEYLDWLIGQEWVLSDLKRDVEEYLEGCAEWHRLRDE